MSFRAKLTASLVVLLALAIAAVSILEIDRTLQVEAGELVTSGELLADQLFEQMRVSLIKRAPSSEPKSVLQQDPCLATLLQSSLAFGKGVVYAAIETPDGKPIVSAGHNPRLDSVAPLPVERLASQAESWKPLALIASLWQDRIYELVRTVQMNGAPFARINVTLSTGLITERIHRTAEVIAGIGLSILVIGSLAILPLTSLLLRPLAVITSGVEQLAAGHSAEGDEETRASVAGGDELSTLAERFNRLVQKVRSERINWEAERGQFFNVFRSITDAVLLLDAQGSLLFANAEALGRLGLPAGGLAEGKRLNLLLGTDHPLVRLVEAAYRTGAEVHDVPFEVSEDGKRARFLVSIFSLGQGPKPAGLLVILRDLAPVNELEDVVTYSGRLARLGGLISGFAHQVRGSLNAMNLQLELVSQSVGESQDAAKHITGIRSRIAQLEQTVGSLMRFLRPEELNLTDVDINALLKELGDRFGSERISIEYDLDPAVGIIRADRALLTEALVNIVENGVQAMPEGGTLKLSSKMVERGTVEIAVQDQGCGIPPEHLGKVFNLYFTTKEGGHGLGLPMALRAIDLHHGTLKVDSTPGVGTTVTMRLPANLDRESLAHAPHPN